MVIRPFRQGDEGALRQVFFSAVHEIASKDYTVEQIAAWAPAPRQADEAPWAERMGRIRPFVAERDGSILGYADVQANGYIDHFFVAGSAARTGVGSALMARIHEAASAQGTASLFAEVSITARPFFEKWGFAVEARQTVTLRGVPLTNFRMRKTLEATPPSRA
ncbi:MAG: GNAT family N-acetyltransferase [Holophaga sp.]|nr:GNAT family N-acetyltransferase [Holophaga sp.]